MAGVAPESFGTGETCPLAQGLKKSMHRARAIPFARSFPASAGEIA
jgi:hypothetical protein